MAILLNGKRLAENVLTNTAEIIQKEKLSLCLGIIQVGNDPASDLYVKNKINKAESVGIKTFHASLAGDITQAELDSAVERFNNDPQINGFYIQSPLPHQLDIRQAVSQINPRKDIDGMSPTSLGNLYARMSNTLVSATPLAVMELLHSIPKFALLGKHAVIINRSAIVGKPLVALLLKEDATVTVCHSKTANLKEICLQADVLITATGIAKLVTGEYVKQGAVVIDCGAPEAEVDFNSVNNVAGYLSPVPGGVGPLTIACLIRNCLYASELVERKPFTTFRMAQSG